MDINSRPASNFSFPSPSPDIAHLHTYHDHAGNFPSRLSPRDPTTPYKAGHGRPLSATSSLHHLAPKASSSLSELLQTSLTDSDLPQLVESHNGFVNACMQAYNTHQHLVLRPDDMWIAIMCQFSSFVEANAEGLRGHFVAHEGQKELTIRKNGTR